MVFLYLKRAYKKEGEQLFIWADSDRKRDNVSTLKRAGLN